MEKVFGWVNVMCIYILLDEALVFFGCLWGLVGFIGVGGVLGVVRFVAVDGFFFVDYVVCVGGVIWVGFASVPEETGGLV